MQQQQNKTGKIRFYIYLCAKIVDALITLVALPCSGINFWAGDSAAGCLWIAVFVYIMKYRHAENTGMKYMQQIKDMQKIQFK